MLPICDNPDRLAARFYSAVRVECACCTFYRGVLIGVTMGAALTALAFTFL